MEIKKFITSLLSIIILSNFACNVSLATEQQNSKSVSKTQEENISLREQKIKIIKDLMEKNDKLYSDNIKSLENMSDADFNHNLKTIKIAKFIGWVIAVPICSFTFYSVILGIKGFEMLYNKINSLGYKKGFKEWFPKYYSIHSSPIDRLINGQLFCRSNKMKSSFTALLNKVLKTFNPNNSSEINNFEDIKKIYYDANDLYNELEK